MKISQRYFKTWRLLHLSALSSKPSERLLSPPLQSLMRKTWRNVCLCMYLHRISGSPTSLQTRLTSVSCWHIVTSFGHQLRKHFTWFFYVHLKSIWILKTIYCPVIPSLSCFHARTFQSLYYCSLWLTLWLFKNCGENANQSLLDCNLVYTK